MTDPCLSCICPDDARRDCPMVEPAAADERRGPPVSEHIQKPKPKPAKDKPEPDTRTPSGKPLRV